MVFEIGKVVRVKWLGEALVGVVTAKFDEAGLAARYRVQWLDANKRTCDEYFTADRLELIADG